MTQILRFVRPTDFFDPETLVMLGGLYDDVLASLRDAGEPLIVRETIAVSILDLASTGERDPDRLRRAALASLGSRL